MTENWPPVLPLAELLAQLEAAPAFKVVASALCPRDRVMIVDPEAGDYGSLADLHKLPPGGKLIVCASEPIAETIRRAIDGAGLTLIE